MQIFKVLGDPIRQEIGGVVYTATGNPYHTDAQGDYCDYPDLIEAATSWEQGGKVVKVMHKGGPINVRVIDSTVTAEQPVEKHGVVIPPFSWFLVLKVLDTGAWSMIRAGRLTGFSLGGKAVATEE